MIRYDGEPTPKVIMKLIEQHDIERYKRLQNYYEGRNDILDRIKKDTSKPNNKLVSSYPSYIVDTMQGYFIGKPINYTSENEDLMNDLQEVFNGSDEQDENSELVKMAGIKGRAYEIAYMNEESIIKFDEMDVDNIIMVYETKINPEVNFSIRYYTIINIETDKEELYADVYTKDKIIKYGQGQKGLVELEVLDHIFGQVPVIEFMNNDEGIGDFERVLTLIDAYDLSQSDTSNDFEEFTDAFLVLAGMMGTDPEDVKKLKEDKVLLTDGEGQSAYWLIKEINDTALENYKNRLKNDIHKFSKVPDMSDEQFASNASGIAMAYKLLALEQVIAGKERKFKRAIQKRIELIFAALKVSANKVYDYRDVQITFTRNIPVNVKEAVETASLLRGFTSDMTALSQLPMVDDVNLEMASIASEIDAYVDLDKVVDKDEEIR